MIFICIHLVLHPDLITFLPTAKDVEEIAGLVQLYSSKKIDLLLLHYIQRVSLFKLKILVEHLKHFFKVMKLLQTFEAHHTLSYAQCNHHNWV